MLSKILLVTAAAYLLLGGFEWKSYGVNFKIQFTSPVKVVETAQAMVCQ